MLSSKLSSGAARAAVAIALLACAAVIASPFAQQVWQRAALAGGSALLLAMSLVIGLRAAAIRQRIEKRYLELLCLLDSQELSADSAAGQFPKLDASWPFTTQLQQLHKQMLQRAEQGDEAAHVRSALEMRMRRTVAAQERLAIILGTLPEPVVAVDAYDEVLFTNASAEKLFDFSSVSAEGRALASLVRCERLVNLLSDTRRRRVPTSRTDEFEITAPDGSVRWYSATASSIPVDGAADGKDASHGAVVVLRDISVQREIQQRNAEFVSAVSHEMKTPLAGIKAYVELLLDGEDEDETMRETFLGVIDSQADRLQRLIENLLNLARIEAGVVKVSKDSQPLNAILEEAIGLVQPSAESKQITLARDLSPMYLGALVDHDLMLQAAINLLSNAIKYTPTGGTVKIRSRMTDDQVVFEVEDTGVGLSLLDCRRIFEKFYRVEQNKSMAPGTGLGLPLAQHIVEDVHGGRLSVDSELGVGSTFTVKLASIAQLS